MIVGREVDRLDETDVTRATVETVAENLVDGIVSPLFLRRAGRCPPWPWPTRWSTPSIPWSGTGSDRYLLFGRFAARMDDVANFIPARLSRGLHRPGRTIDQQTVDGPALGTAWRDGRSHASPNAGYPEAAFAGALGLWMGGPNRYHGRLVEKPVIGNGSRQRPTGPCPAGLPPDAGHHGPGVYGHGDHGRAASTGTTVKSNPLNSSFHVQKIKEKQYSPFHSLATVCKKRFPFSLACPSFVYPAGYVDNVRHLAPLRGTQSSCSFSKAGLRTACPPRR